MIIKLFRAILIKKKPKDNDFILHQFRTKNAIPKLQ